MARKRSSSARARDGRATQAASADPSIAWRAAAIALAVLLVYANSVSAPFLFDDHTSIVENPRIRQLWPLSIPLSPPHDTPVAGRPVVNLSFALNYAFGGLRVQGYHIVNIAIHLLAALTLFGIVHRTLALPKLAGRWRSASVNIAFACALIWALHPLQTEAVSYLTERTESLMGLFYLVTLYAGIRSFEEHGRSRWQSAAVAACVLGMASKESMVTAPLVVVLFDRVFVFESLRQAVRKRWALYLGLFASWIVLAALMWSVPRTSVGFTAGVSPLMYFVNQIPIVARYLWLSAWPRALVLDYGVPHPVAIREVIAPAVLMAMLGVATLAALVFRPMLGFLGAWIFVTLAPTSSIVPIATEVGAERRMYLPLAALVVLSVLGVRALLLKVPTGVGRTRPVVSGFGRTSAGSVVSGSRRTNVTALALAVVFLLLATGTVARNREYRSRLTMAQTIVDRRPHGRAHFILGTELINAGRHEEAMAHFRKSASDYPGARYALGIEMVAAGDLDKGIAELETFLRALPTHPNAIPAREMIGRALIAEQRFDEAEQQLTSLLNLVPTHAAAHRLMGDVHLSRGEPGEAIRAYEESLRYQPGNVDVLQSLGIALGTAGRIDEAIKIFERVAAARPADPVAPNLLGHAFALQGRFQDAAVQFRRAVALDPSYAEARANLAAAESALGVRPR